MAAVECYLNQFFPGNRKILSPLVRNIKVKGKVLLVFILYTCLVTACDI